MSQTPLDSTPVGMNMWDAKIIPLDPNPIGAKISGPKTLTLPTKLSKNKEKAHKQYVPEDLESEPSFSDSSSSESDSSDDRKYRKSKIK